MSDEQMPRYRGRDRGVFDGPDLHGVRRPLESPVSLKMTPPPSPRFRPPAGLARGRIVRRPAGGLTHVNHRSPWPVLAAALAGAIAVATCRDSAVAPRESRAGPPVGPSPAADQQTSDPGGALTATLPGNDSRTGSGVVALGSLGTEPVLVKAVASGILQMYPYGDLNQPPGAVDPNGIFLFTENSCKANVEVAGANGTYVRYCDAVNTNPLVETVERYAILQGDVSAWRTGGPQPSFGPARLDINAAVTEVV